MLVREAEVNMKNGPCQLPATENIVISSYSTGRHLYNCPFFSYETDKIRKDLDVEPEAMKILEGI